MDTRKIILIANLSAILFVLEQALYFLPNITLTIFLIILYTRALGYKITSIIVIIHVVLDNLLWGSLNLTVFPFMLLGLLIIPITLDTIFKNVVKATSLAFLAIMYSFIYCFLFFIPNIYILRLPFLGYLITDIPFELLLATSSFVATLWLYNPLKKVLDGLINKNIE